jgi:hypothetical protein
VGASRGADVSCPAAGRTGAEDLAGGAPGACAGAAFGDGAGFGDAAGLGAAGLAAAWPPGRPGGFGATGSATPTAAVDIRCASRARMSPLTACVPTATTEERGDVVASGTSDSAPNTPITATT